MIIKWYGHSCFLLTDVNGVSILTDPYEPSVGRTLSGIECSAVTISHDHFDHNYIAAAAGAPTIINTIGTHDVKGVRVTGFPSFHDDVHGKKRGENIMFLFEMDGIRVLHAGDIGHMLSADSIAAIGDVDVLLVPVGGKYTLNYTEARQFANQLRPSVVIPMHYRTPKSKIDIDDVNNFISTAKDCRIHRLNDYEATLSRQSLGEDRVIVLDPFDPSKS